MNRVIGTISGVALLLAVAAGGYWYGVQKTEDRGQRTEKTEGRKLLFYRNPMGLPDTSPVPKKDPMGMDYTPVYEGGEPEAAVQGEVVIDTARVQKLGVTSETAARRELTQALRLTGRVEADERRLYTIAPKFEGWVERLHVNTTGEAVRKGQPLFEVYSPELASALREQALVAEAQDELKEADAETRAGMEQLARAGTERLKNWDVRAGDATRAGRLIYRAPAAGIVLEKKAVEGMRFMAGEMLYRIADLSSVWIIADVPEQDIAAVKVGDAAEVRAEAFPQQVFKGQVDFVYPVMNEATRTVPVRIVIANPDGMLKPAMFAQATLETGARAAVLAVPSSAVIDSGAKQVVLVRLAEGRFAPREVKLGMKGGDYVEVLEGVAEGEQVVTSANFLIDAESNLKAALGGFGHAQGGATPTAAKNPSQPPQPLPASPSQGRRGGGAETPAQGGKQAGTVGHQGQGKLEAINSDGTVKITHGPIASLNWPGMTMDFALANSSLAANVKPGSAIEFEIVERGEGEWVITKMQPTAAQHEGH